MNRQGPTVSCASTFASSMRLLLLLLGLTVSVNAQPASIDGEFAYALLGLDPESRIVPGTVPDSLDAFFPDDALALGLLTRSVEWIDGDLTLAVARTDRAPEAVLAVYAEREVGGWALEPSRPHEEPAGGFAATPSVPGSLRFRPTGDAAPAAIVEVSAFERPKGGSYVRVAHRLAGPREDPAAWREPHLAHALPVLSAPQGATQRPTGGSGSSDHTVQRATLESDLPLHEVGDHFDAQMSAGGWAPVAVGAAADRHVSTWTRDVDGEPVTATLEAVASEPGRYALTAVVIGRDR